MSVTSQSIRKDGGVQQCYSLLPGLSLKNTLQTQSEFHTRAPRTKSSPKFIHSDHSHTRLQSGLSPIKIESVWGYKHYKIVHNCKMTNIIGQTAQKELIHLVPNLTIALTVSVWCQKAKYTRNYSHRQTQIKSSNF